MGEVLRARSVQTSAAVGGLLAALHFGASPLPWPLWVAWAGVTAWSISNPIRKQRAAA